MINPSPSDDALREHLLPDLEFKDAEAKYPGVIHLVLVTRTRARLAVMNELWNFELVDSQDKTYEGEKELRGWQGSTKHIPSRTEVGPVLWDLMWHKVAEAMAAVRKGQVEAKINREKRKQAREDRLARDAHA